MVKYLQCRMAVAQSNGQHKNGMRIFCSVAPFHFSGLIAIEPTLGF